MSYEPTTWKAGDTVTSAKLNKLEQGLATNILFVQVIANDDSPTTYHLDRTWQEIHDAPFAVIKHINEDPYAMSTFVVNVAQIYDESYAIIATGNPNVPFIAFANSPDEYPVIP